MQIITSIEKKQFSGIILMHNMWKYNVSYKTHFLHNVYEL